MSVFQNIDVVVFDADDTLWDCQGACEEMEKEYCALLAPWADAETVSTRLFETEMRNMPLLGYGFKALTLSLMENAYAVTNGQISADVLMKIQQMGYALLHLPATPLPGVQTVLHTVREKKGLRTAVFTKGEAHDQLGKLSRSGLEPLFDVVEVVSDKTEAAFQHLCTTLQTPAEHVLMVGNSFKSDIAPALAVGCSAVFIPYHTTWQHEVVETFEHDCLVTIDNIAQLPALLP